MASFAPKKKVAARVTKCTQLTDLVNARGQQLYDCEVLSGFLEGLSGGPVIERALHLDVAATVAP